MAWHSSYHEATAAYTRASPRPRPACSQGRARDQGGKQMRVSACRRSLSGRDRDRFCQSQTCIDLRSTKIMDRQNHQRQRSKEGEAHLFIIIFPQLTRVHLPKSCLLVIVFFRATILFVVQCFSSEPEDRLRDQLALDGIRDLRGAHVEFDCVSSWVLRRRGMFTMTKRMGVAQVNSLKIISEVRKISVFVFIAMPHSGLV